MTHGKVSDTSDDRGVASQIDLLNAGLLIVGVTFLFIANTAIAMDSLSEVGGDGNAAVSTRAADALASDVFVDDVNQSFVNETCIEAYTTRSARSKCWTGEFDNTSDIRYLRSSLGVGSGYTINVTITSTGDPRDVQCPLSKCTIGPQAPTRDDVAVYHRWVAWETASGQVEYQRVYVYVWGSGVDS